MTLKLSKYVKSRLTHNQEAYLDAGERKAQELTTLVEECLGVASHVKVEAKRQSLIEGPPGIGKSYTANQTCILHGVQPITIASGASLPWIASKLAYAEYWTPPGQEVVVMFDDADDVVFDSKATINTWKEVFTDEENIPTFNHSKNISSEISKLKKMGKDKMVEALMAYMPEDETGISIDLARFRFIFLTNTDYELTSEKKTWQRPVVDRFNYNRLAYDDTTAWGWLTYVLLTSQPFEKKWNVVLSEKEKMEIACWLFDKWDRMGKRVKTYRMVREMAQYIVNEPTNYLNRWEKYICLEKKLK